VKNFERWEQKRERKKREQERRNKRKERQEFKKYCLQGNLKQNYKREEKK